MLLLKLKDQDKALEGFEKLSVWLFEKKIATDVMRIPGSPVEIIKEIGSAAVFIYSTAMLSTVR